MATIFRELSDHPSYMQVTVLCVNYRKSICPTMMSLLGLPKADTKSGSKAGSKDEMAAILGHTTAKVIFK